MQTSFPIFVREKDCGEIWQFDSVHEFQTKFEKIDIENEEFEAWDKDGVPLEVKLQEPVWIRLEPLTGSHSPDQLRHALLAFARSVGIDLPDQLPASAFAMTLDQIRTAQEKKMLAASPVRRFFARLRNK